MPHAMTHEWQALRTVHRCAKAYLTYLERSLLAGPLSRVPGREGLLLTALRQAVAEVTEDDEGQAPHHP